MTGPIQPASTNVANRADVNDMCFGAIFRMWKIPFIFNQIMIDWSDRHRSQEAMNVEL